MRCVVAVSAGFADMSTGDTRSLALTADGSIWSWGSGARRMLGHGNEENQWQPKRIEALAGHRGTWHRCVDGTSFAITADGAIWSWGQGALGHYHYALLASPTRLRL